MPPVEDPQPQGGDTIREDFDRIAHIPGGGWNHNSHYHRYILRRIPLRMDRVLDVGCGKGEFTRRMAERAARVEGIDLSPDMIAEAQKLSAGCPNIDYSAGDIRKAALKPGQYDCIASIATLHHLPLKDILEQLKSALAEGGVLAVLDLYRAQTVWDIIVSAVAFPANALCRLVKTGRIRDAHRAEWLAHSDHDVILPLHEIRTVCRAVLPGARVTRHLFWRYSILWRKPGK